MVFDMTVNNNKSNSRFGESLGTRADYCTDTICTIIFKFSVVPISGGKLLKKKKKTPNKFIIDQIYRPFLVDSHLR